MEYLKEMFDIYNFEIFLVMGVAIVFLLILNIVNNIKISRTLKKYKEINKILSVANSENIEETLVSYVREVDFIKNSLNSVETRCEDVSERITRSIQGIGFIRYNAFDDIGSDLSFSIALLDGNANGFVMSNIYARDESNVYGKPIKNGSSTYQLSIEEKEAVDRAMSKFKKATI